jgi:hypothetical protein
MNMLENKEIRVTATNEIDAVRALRDDELDAVSGGAVITVAVSPTGCNTAIGIEGKGVLVFSNGCAGPPTAHWIPA